MRDNTKQVLMKGNEALAEAAVRAGCMAYFGYPITPQSEISAYLSWRLAEVPDAVYLQAESELAAISMLIGAAAGGARVLTSSSSPGISLMQEGISFLAGAKLGAVIVNVMRAGPGLGGIAGAQADYFQAVKGGGNGDYRTIVLAPASVQDMIDHTIKAFELADKYNIVVMIISDGYIGQMSEPVVLPELESSPPRNNKDFILDGAEGRDQHVVSSLHLEDGGQEAYIKSLRDLYSKIEEDETEAELLQCEDAEIIITAYGIAARICIEAIIMLRERGIRVGLFRPISLFPFPKKELFAATKNARQLLVVEMSLGQYVEDVRLYSSRAIPIELYSELGGSLPAVDKIIEKVLSYD